MKERENSEKSLTFPNLKSGNNELMLDNIEMVLIIVDVFENSLHLPVFQYLTTLYCLLKS